MTDKGDVYIVPATLLGRRRAVIYTRVSTRNQVKGSGLHRQVEGCAAFADHAGLQVIAIHQDAGVSGALYLAREGLQAALHELDVGNADVLIVESPDRLSRKRLDMELIDERVEAADAVLIFSEAQLVGSPLYVFLHRVSNLLDEFERDCLEGRAY